jgi:hypothetical protein
MAHTASVDIVIALSATRATAPRADGRSSVARWVLVREIVKATRRAGAVPPRARSGELGFGAAVWVLGSDVRSRASGRSRPRPASRRSPAPAGVADVLVASDRALQGGVRITATQMTLVIMFVLRVGTGVDLLGPDGLTPLPLLARSAVASERGVFVNLPGVVTERLPTRRGLRPAVRPHAGRRHGRAGGEPRRAGHRRRAGRDRPFGRHPRIRPRGPVAHACGRRSPRRLLLRPAGDISESPVTVVRGRRERDRAAHRSAEGGVVELVTRPRAALVGGDG